MLIAVPGQLRHSVVRSAVFAILETRDLAADLGRTIPERQRLRDRRNHRPDPVHD